MGHMGRGIWERGNKKKESINIEAVDLKPGTFGKFSLFY